MKSSFVKSEINKGSWQHKWGLLSLFGLSMLFGACKEQRPGGLILTSLESKDTSYVSNQIETPQTKKVVIEELTGVKCPNCPAGSAILHNFAAQNPNRIIITAIHSGFLTDPLPNSIYDFRNADADGLRLFFPDGDPPKPSACFDRVPALTGNYFIVKAQTIGEWQNALNARLSVATPVNIHLTSSYDINSNKVNVNAKLHFTADVTDHLGLTLYVLESGKVDAQDSSGVELEDYEFEHVLQKIITPVSGELILDSLATKVKGRVLEKSLSFTPVTSGANAWNLDKCVIIGIVHRTGASREILHAEEVNLK
jgi:hypothetical protein